MKRALITVLTIQITCPYCAEAIPDPDYGSHIWEPQQIPSIVKCVYCSKDSAIPNRVSLKQGA
jgi:hypothetical protein